MCAAVCPSLLHCTGSVYRAEVSKINESSFIDRQTKVRMNYHSDMGENYYSDTHSAIGCISKEIKKKTSVTNMAKADLLQYELALSESFEQAQKSRAMLTGMPPLPALRLPGHASPLLPTLLGSGADPCVL